MAFVVGLSTPPLSASTRWIASENSPEGEWVRRAQGLGRENKIDEAAALLKPKIASESDKDKRGLLRFSLALIYIQTGRDADAETEIKAALEDGLRIDDFAHFQLGILYRKAGRLSDARAAFTKAAANTATPGATVNEARFQLGELAIQEKDWKTAERSFTLLRKALRSDPHYPEVLFYSMLADFKLGRKANACKWAREIYAKYPTFPRVKNWGIDLANNTIDDSSVEGAKLGCSVSDKDMKTRVRRLQLGGEADRATAELRGIREKWAEGTYSIDAMIANHLISEGSVEEAMKILLKHYDSQRRRAPYLALLAKAASRAGDYQTAIGTYMRAYELAPRSQASAGSLFQAAFTSYQIQDYDGATKRFQLLAKTFPASRFARDARWHLAWIRYLRGDYAGALDSMKALASGLGQVNKKGRRRANVKVDALTKDRARYWSAMSLLRMGKKPEAAVLFQELVRDPALGFYAVASYYRLLSIPDAKVPTSVEIRLGLRKAGEGGGALSEEEMKAASESVAEAQAEYESEDAKAAGEVEESDDVAENSEVSEGADQAEVAAEESAGFKDSSLVARFARARDLSFVGLQDSARRELADIERRARRSEDRRLLMSEYVQVRNYYRSSYMGEVGFGVNRLRGGLIGDGKTFWEFAYPRAWEPTVLQSAKSTLVPEELIWGIMRAESHFRQDAQSPVGALGLMQLMPFTGRQVASLLSMNSFETRSLLDADTNIRLGSRYLQRLLEKFSGSVPLVAAGYNAGPHRVHAWVRNFGSLDMDEFIEHIPFVETRNYVKKVVRNYQIYGWLYSGKHPMPWLVQPVGVQLSEQVPTKEIW